MIALKVFFDLVFWGLMIAAFVSLYWGYMANGYLLALWACGILIIQLRFEIRKLDRQLIDASFATRSAMASRDRLPAAKDGP